MQAASSAEYGGQGRQQSAQQLHPQHPEAGLDLSQLFKGCTAYEPVRIAREEDNCISLSRAILSKSLSLVVIGQKHRLKPRI